jgi:hypothetical protein
MMTTMQTWQNRLSTIPVFRSLVVIVLAVMAFETGGIWRELKGLRREQVKNAVWTLRPDQLARIRAGQNADVQLRSLEHMVQIQYDDPIQVRIEDSVPVSVEIKEPVKIDDSLPVAVEIQR